MDLPCDIWIKILLHLKSSKNCKKLYNALPCSIQNDIKEIYDKHMESIADKIICNYGNKILLYKDDKLVNIEDNEIKFVKFIPITDEMVIATNDGRIRFMDRNREIKLRHGYIENLEFHPNGKIMATKAGYEIKLWFFEDNGHIYSNRCKIIYGRNDKSILLFHPNLPYLIIGRCNLSTNELIEIFKWKYDRINRDAIIRNIPLNYYHGNKYYVPMKMSKDERFIEVIMEFKLFGMNNNDGVFIQRIPIDDIHVKNTSIDIYTKIVNDFLWNNDKLFYCNDKIIEKNITTKEEKIIYKSSELIRKMIYKNNGIIFVEGKQLKRIELETNEIDIIFNLQDEVIFDYDISR